jgi:glycosyltransferase involved in cell wall biosynthesis
MRIAAYIPCLNNAATLPAALASLRAQTVQPERILVVDDCSRDATARVAHEFGAEVIRHGTQLGRGAARNSAMDALEAEFVLCCDATNRLEPDFTERALEHFADARVAAVFGRLRSGFSDTAPERWKQRHLFKADGPQGTRHGAYLSTWGAIVRRAPVQACGGYDRSLRHSEDADLGERLLRAGYDVVHDTSLGVVSSVRNTTAQVLERYWRWYVGAEQKGAVRFVLDQFRVSLRIQLPADIARRDGGSALISLAMPFACAWHSMRSRK